MTEIKLEQVGNRFVVDIEGHAKNDESGSALVCAGISTLAQAYAFYMAELDDSSRVTILESDIYDGYAYIVVEGNIADILPAFRMLSVGLEAIADTYPSYCYLSGEIV